MPILEFEVGKPFPGELDLKTGLLTTMDTSKGDNGIEALFVASLPNIDPREIDALVLEPIHFGILLYEPLVFILLRASDSTFLDSPFGIGLYPPERVEALLASARYAHGWRKNIRRSTNLVVVDPVTMIIRGLRYMMLTRNWWIVLSDALERCPKTLSREDYMAAIRRAYSQWSSTEEIAAALHDYRRDRNLT